MNRRGFVGMLGALVGLGTSTAVKTKTPVATLQQVDNVYGGGYVGGLTPNEIRVLRTKTKASYGWQVILSKGSKIAPLNHTPKEISF